MSTEQEKVEKTLGEPFAMDFPDYVRKIRNGLIVISVISTALLSGGLQIADDSSFLGLRFEGLTNALVFKVIFFLNAYMFLHFFWCSIDHFQEWRLRLTGTRVAFVTTGRFSSEVGDYPNDPRQSTLYNWWKDEARKRTSFQEPLETIQKKLEEWEATVKDNLEGNNPNVVNACMSINQISTDIQKLKNSVEQVGKSIKSQRIPVSLKRFDGHFQFYLRSQNLRWLFLELGFPLVLGGYALFLLLCALTLPASWQLC